MIAQDRMLFESRVVKIAIIRIVRYWRIIVAIA